MNHFRKYFSGIKSETGATLLVIIIAMVVVALLGAGMFSLFYTSSLNQAEAQKTAKANYLAESGIRIVASEFRHSATQNTTLVNLNNKTFNFAGTGGSFKLKIYPYWFYINASYPVHSTSIILYLPGSLPPVNSDDYTPVTIPTDGILKLKDNTKVAHFTAVDITQPEGANGKPATVTIASPGFPYALSPGSELFMGYIYNANYSIDKGEDLVFNDPNNTAQMYPPTNGSINIAQSEGYYQYTYESRDPLVIDPASPPASFKLKNIQPAKDVAQIPIFPIVIQYRNWSYAPCNNDDTDVRCTTQIFLGRTLGIKSTSTYSN